MIPTVYPYLGSYQFPKELECKEMKTSKMYDYGKLLATDIC